MKKTRQIFGAIALSAVLAMGTAVPAFAATGDSNLDTNEANVSTATQVDDPINAPDANKASTAVSIATYSSNYNVTVPLKLPFVLDQMGGSANNFVPTNYFIQNNGPAAVQVDQIDWSLATADNKGTNTDLKPFYTFGKAFGTSSELSSTAGLTGTAADPTWHATLYNGETTAAAPQYGSFVIKMSPTLSAGAGSVVETTCGTALTGYTCSTDNALNGKTGTGYTPWKLEAAAVDQDNRTADIAAGTATAGKYPIALDIWCTQLHNAAEKSLDDVASIMYTISPVH